MQYPQDNDALLEATRSAECAKITAQEANAAKDRFLALLSHELRTPLTPVLATLSLLQQQPKFDAETREYLELIRRNIELEVRLIDDLLDITRINRGKLEVIKKPVEIGAIVSSAVEICRPDIEARRLSFEVDIQHAPHIVSGDAVRLQQMFWNLIKNAIKFTPAGGKFRIRGWRENAEVVLEIKDNGVGIEPEALGRIFNPFEQLDREITRQFGGLGLGLAITKAMAEIHGGRIEAHSEGKNRGATFTVRLPIANAAAAGSPAPSDVPPLPKAPDLRPLKILLVEDHQDSAEMLGRLLSKKGYDVQIAGAISTGLEAAGQRGFDLILSDLGLPDGTGMELLRQLRARGQTIPAIALSGHGQEQDVQKSLHAGFAAHLIKPVNLNQLNETISAVVRRPHHGQPLL